jgi:hypothetical protein
MTILITITGPIDSRLLWAEIARYRVNLTDLEDKVVIHGCADINTALKIIKACAPYGKLNIELSYPP